MERSDIKKRMFFRFMLVLLLLGGLHSFKVIRNNSLELLLLFVGYGLVAYSEIFDYFDFYAEKIADLQARVDELEAGPKEEAQ